MLHVIYDDQCGFCIRSMKVCRALDIGKRLQFLGASAFRVPASREGGQLEGHAALANADFENAMFAVAPDGTVSRGFFAFRRIARAVPLMWPLLTLLYFPGSGLIGPRVYAWVAGHRRLFGCESEVCELPAADRPRS